MAQFLRKIKINQEEFDLLTDFLQARIIERSMSASLEEKMEYELSGVVTRVMGFERFSYAGNNRVSLNIVLTYDGENVVIVGFSTGGTQALFTKIYTLGEETFLQELSECIDEFLAILDKKRNIELTSKSL